MTNMKFVRMEKGVTLSELSDQTGINRNTLNGIERARTNPRPDEVKRIAKALEIPEDRLLLHVSGETLPAGAEARDSYQREKEGDRE
jgi:transcriptional regulator with XRE-family HTH domain